MRHHGTVPRKCAQCGKDYLARPDLLKMGIGTTCGRICAGAARRLPDRGATRARIYGIWKGMQNRCFDPFCPEYRFYGERGISVCPEWETSFEAFYQWAISHGHDPNLSIERIDNNGNYEPNNCKWATRVEQANNKRSNILVTAFGETKTITGWIADPRFATNRKTFDTRLRQGWDHERAITSPSGKNGRKRQHP